MNDLKMDVIEYSLSKYINIKYMGLLSSASYILYKKLKNLLYNIKKYLYFNDENIEMLFVTDYNTDYLYKYYDYDYDYDIPDKYKDFSDYYGKFYQNYLIDYNNAAIYESTYDYPSDDDNDTYIDSY